MKRTLAIVSILAIAAMLAGGVYSIPKATAQTVVVVPSPWAATIGCRIENGQNTGHATFTLPANTRVNIGFLSAQALVQNGQRVYFQLQTTPPRAGTVTDYFALTPQLSMPNNPWGGAYPMTQTMDTLTLSERVDIIASSSTLVSFHCHRAQTAGVGLVTVTLHGTSQPF
jgi:hypothetical protein